MHPITHICRPCNKNFNSEEQQRAHERGRKHKLRCSDKDNHGNKNTIDEGIQKLRALGISFPKVINKVIRCQKLHNQGRKLNTSNMTELVESCVLMEGEKILGIYVDSFFPSQTCQKLYDLLDFIYEHGGFVERGQRKIGGDMVMVGWRLDTFIDKPVV